MTFSEMLKLSKLGSKTFLSGKHFHIRYIAFYEVQTAKSSRLLIKSGNAMQLLTNHSLHEML